MRGVFTQLFILRSDLIRFVDTAIDIVDMNLTHIWPPGRETIIQRMAEDQNTDLAKQLANHSYVAEVISGNSLYKMQFLLRPGKNMKNWRKLRSLAPRLVSPQDWGL